jgi:hypothetical protein
MDCNIFKKRLEDYVLGNISSDLKIALDKHLEECESCRRLYEEEVKLDSDFKRILLIDGIEFNSSRASIINSIDKNRYSKKKSNKILYNFRKYKSRYLSYAAVATVMIVFAPMMLKGFVGGNYGFGNSKKNASSIAVEGCSEGKSKTSNSYGATKWIGENKAGGSELKKGSEAADNEKNSPLQFQSSIITKQALPNLELKWQNSRDGKNSATIDTTPGGDVDFGIHAIYIKNINTDKIVKYQVINNERQYTPRNIEWWDNEHLIIMAGLGYGTVAFGSEMYSLNINTGKLSTLYKTKDEKYQMLNMKKTGNDLILELLIYNDDTKNAHHSGVGKMTLLQLDKPVNMIIESEEKK